MCLNVRLLRGRLCKWVYIKSMISKKKQFRRASGSDSGGRQPAAKGTRAALRETQQREREISALLAAARAALQEHYFPATARAIFDIVKQLIGATAGYVALLSRDGERNEVLFLDAGGRVCTVNPDLPMPNRGLRALAYQQVRTVYDNNFEDSEWMEFMPQGHVTLDNVMFAPLMNGTRSIGLIGLANKEGGFTDEDARVASAFGDLASIALLNAQREDQLKTALAEKETLLRELHHRTKNNMQVITAMLSIQQNFTDNPDVIENLNNVRERIQSMTLVHQKLYQSGDLSTINLAEYIRDLAMYMKRDYPVSSNVEMRFDLEEIQVLIDTAIPCGLVLNELISNALRHAFSEGGLGEICFSLKHEDYHTIMLAVSDNGRGLPPGFDPRRDGKFGFQTLFALVEHQLRGKVMLQSDPGFTCTVRINNTLYHPRI